MTTIDVKVAFLFPGQGAQTVGMGASVCARVPAARALFDRASSVLGYDLYDLCVNGPASRLDSTVYSQPALFVASLAALEDLKQNSPELIEWSAAAAGLSLGEYTALVFAGVMDFESGLRVVQERGRAMQDAADATSSGMVSVLGLQREQIESLCNDVRQDETLKVANLLCPGNIVVSGHRGACERIADAATAAGAMKVIPLAVAGAFHTPLMQPAVDRLRAALANVPLQRPRIPVISNVDARPHDDPNEIRELLIQQVCSQVRWEDSMRYLLEQQGITSFYEIGPGRVLCGLLKRIARKVPCENVAA
ncbi:MAG TPA: ACP S-malonyltransferase [Lacipirellulaceae bacterium]|jgi:[acyl-carrier-protein] S-malonyltransferase|nr:ACP S-malonyltransferase [Lacipirellulaceae bacterium]